MNYIYHLSFPIKLKSSKLIVVLGGFCLFFLCNTLRAQQEPMYSQYMFNMINLNPAYAGSLWGDNVTLLYRAQWMGVDGAPRTGTLSWDTRAPDSNIGYGLQIYDDRLGVEVTSGAQAFYSYRLQFPNSNFVFGLSGGVLNYRAIYSKVTTTDQKDPLFDQDVNVILPSVGFGVLYNTERIYMGFSIPALLKTKVNTNSSLVSANNHHYFLTGGGMVDLSSDFKLEPSALLKVVEGSPLSFDLNMSVWYQNLLGGGISYRYKDALVGIFEVQLSPTLRLGYAYDYILSDLKTYNFGGSHEIMLRYEFNMPKFRKVLSPKYFCRWCK